MLMVTGTRAQSATTVMLEQIAKLEVLLAELKKGYDIVNKGLNLINDIKHGDFNLHSDYFNSLSTVKGPIKNDSKIAAMIAMQVQMVTNYSKFMQSYKNAKVFTTSELNYLANVYSALLNDVAEDIGLLTDIITDGTLQMKDDERIHQIDQLYQTTHEQYEFESVFHSQIQLQALQRQKSLQEIQHLQILQ
jgi:hypothetical protein